MIHLGGPRSCGGVSNLNMSAINANGIFRCFSPRNDLNIPSLQAMASSDSSLRVYIPSYDMIVINRWV